MYSSCAVLVDCSIPAATWVTMPATCFNQSCVTVFVGVVSAISETMFYDVLLSFTHLSVYS